MLNVVLKQNAFDPGKGEFEFHIPFHNGSLPKFDNEEIDYIQADGDELGDILATFQKELSGPGTAYYTIPVPNRRVIRWYGDIAKTIYYNLR